MSAIPRAIHFDNAGLLYIKVAAFVLMLADHADWLLGAGQGPHSDLGRLVFPLFGFVLALNLSRVQPDRILSELVPRALLVAAIAALPFFILLGPLPLNIMFTIAAAMACYALTEKGQFVNALALFLFAGLFVDYSWPGIAGITLLAAVFRNVARPWAIWTCFAVFALGLTAINGNLWALAALPLAYAAQFLRGDAPRWKALFYVGYPVHLYILAAIKLAS